MRKLLIIFLVLNSWLTTYAQPDTPFEHLPIPGAINSSQVNDIVIDQHGLIWIAGDGLFRYDGFKFTSYKKISPTQSIAGKELLCILAGKDSSKLYLGTHSYGIVEYNYNTNTFRVIPSKGGIPIISMLAQTDDGTVWTGSFSNGIYRIENDTLRKIHDPKSRFQIPTNLVPLGNTLLVDKQRKIYRLKNGAIIDSILVDYPNVEFSINTRLTAMSTDSKGHLWLGMERGGVLVYDTLTKKYVKYFAPDKAPFYHRINKIFEAKNGLIWILTKANGLAIYNPATDTFVHLTKNPLNESSLTGNNCTSIVQDKTGIIWIGATGDLNKYDQAKIKFKHIYNNPFSALSLNDNMVRGVYEDKNEKLWIGTDGGIIHIIDRKNSTMEKIPITISGNTQHVIATYFLELDEHTMLIGSSIGFLQCDLRTKKIDYYKPFEKIKNRQIRQIIKNEDTLYFIHSGALFVYNLRTKATKFITKFGDETIVNATTIYLDLQKRLWVGVSNGISLYHPEKDTFTYFEFEKNPDRPLGSYFMVLSIIEHQNKLWVGTFNSGLWTLDLKNLEHPTIKNISGLPDNTVYATLPDGAGNLWLSTNQGIVKYDVVKNHFLNFGLSDGIQHEEFNRLAAIKCKNGEIVFGGINGLNIFDPENIALPEEEYKPVLLGVSIYKNRTSEVDYTGLLQQSSLTLTHKENNIDLQFFIPNYRSPKRYEVYYQLIGYDPDWVKTEVNTIHYSNLSPGNYSLKVKTISVNGVESETEYPINIQYPIWETWWFVSLFISALALLIYTIIISNIRKAKRDKFELEKLLRLRTQEIEKSREELANLNQKKDVIFSILSHDLRAPLTTLKGFLSLLIDNHELLSTEDIKRHATSIRNSVTSSLDLIDNTLFWSLSQTGNINYTPTVLSLSEVLKKISDLYQLTATKKQITLSVYCHEDIKLYADENMVYVTLRNLIANALKFTSEAKLIEVSAIKNGEQAEITVKDQGIGMSASYIEKLLSEEHVQLKLGTSNEKGTGLGINLCKKFIQVNNGKLEITSDEGKGSEFKVYLPLSQD